MSNLALPIYLVLFFLFFFFFNDTATTEIYTLSLHDALPIYLAKKRNLHIVNEHFEPYFNAVLCRLRVFQQSVRVFWVL